jgi:hypothetical protein
MTAHADVALALTAFATLAPAISDPSGSPAPMTRPVAVWMARGWTPAHRMCEMDGPTLSDIVRWRCVRSTDGDGWELQTQSPSR